MVLLAAMPMCNKTVTCTPHTEINNCAAVGWGARGEAHCVVQRVQLRCTEVQSKRSVRDWLSSSEKVL